MTCAARLTAQGFTLLEVLVVMLIVGVLSTAATLSLAPDVQRQLDDEAYRLARVLEQAAEAAELGDALTLTLDAGGYRFTRPGPDGLPLAVRDDFLAARRWPDGIAVRQLSGPPPPWPLWQDNRCPALALLLASGAAQRVLALSPLGRVEVRRP